MNKRAVDIEENLIKDESENEVAQLCLTLCDPWTVAHQAPPSMVFSRQEYYSGLPFPSPGDLPDPGIEPRSPTLQADALTSVPPGKLIKDKEIVNSEVRGLHDRQELFASESVTTFCSPNKGLFFDCITTLPSVTRHPSLQTVWPPFQKGRHLAPQNLSQPRSIG